MSNSRLNSYTEFSYGNSSPHPSLNRVGFTLAFLTTPDLAEQRCQNLKGSLQDAPFPEDKM